LHIASTNTIPFSTTFLLLDRILAISFIGDRLYKWRQNIQWMSIFALSTVFFGNLAVLFWRTLIAPADAKTGNFIFNTIRLNRVLRFILRMHFFVPYKHNNKGSTVCKVGDQHFERYLRRYLRLPVFETLAKFKVQT
jgi:hypothetical protein